MLSLVESGKPVTVIAPAAYSSAATTGDYINMKNYDKVTFWITTGVVTTGGNVKIIEAKDASSTSAATLDIATFWEDEGTGVDAFTQRSADSSSSAGCVTIADADDATNFIVEVRAEQLSPSFDYVTASIPAAFRSANMCIVAVGHKARYQSYNPPTALT